MKSLILFLLCVFSMTGVHSQHLEYFTGPKIEKYDDASFHLYDMDSLNLYAFSIDKKNYFLEIYDRKTLERSYKIKIPLPSKDSIKYSLENLFTGKDTFQIFYSFFDWSISCKRLEMITFNKAGIMIGDTKLIDKSGGDNEIRAGGFSVIDWKINNEFLSIGYKKIKDTSAVNISHFDYSGNKLFAKRFLLNNKSGYGVYSFMIEDCNFYRLTRSKRGNRNVKWGIQFYSPDVDSVQIIELKQLTSREIYLSEISHIYFDKKKRIDIVSPYSTDPESKYAEGIYLVQINSKTHTLIKESVIPFKVQKEKSSDENDPSLSFLIPAAIIPMSDDRLKFVFESRSQVSGNKFGMGDIISVDLDSSNTITELHKIKKQQVVRSPDFIFTGFAILNHENKSYFIYNELPENLLCTPDKMIKVTSSRIDETEVIYTVVDSGKVVRKVLIKRDASSGIDAILPFSYLSAFDRHEIYVLRKIKTDVYLTKIFVQD